jgi:tetratricopeptide (TPR) repeat protein
MVKMPMEMKVRHIAYLGAALAVIVGLTSPCLCQTSGAGDEQSRRAIALEQQGKPTEAEAAWRQDIKMHPSDPEAYANFGLFEARQQHYKDAIPLYRKALALDPSMPGLRLNLGLSLFKSGELNDAVHIFLPLLKMAARSSPEESRLATLLGLSYYGLGRYSAAIPYLQRATDADPQNLPFRFALAESCLASKQYKCVLDVYTQILQLNSDSAEADMLAGEAYDGMGNDAAALQQFRAAAKADPKMPHVHFGVGYLLWRAKQFSEAAQEFNAELAIDPDDPQALTYLADTDMHSGMDKAAAPLLERAIRIDPQLELAHLDAGILYSNAGRKAEALREFKSSEKLSPSDVQVHWRLARFYQSTGNKQEAQIEFEKTRNIDKTAKDRATLLNQLHDAGSKAPSAAQN